MKILSAAHLAKDTRKFLEMVQREPTLIVNNGKPIALSLSIADAEALLQCHIDESALQTLKGVDSSRRADMLVSNYLDVVRRLPPCPE